MAQFFFFFFFFFLQLLISGQQFAWEVAKIPENKKKNRYANIIACKLTPFCSASTVETLIKIRFLKKKSRRKFEASPSSTPTYSLRISSVRKSSRTRIRYC